MDKRIRAFFIIFLLLPVAIFAETITLKSGKTVEGMILEKTNDSLKIDIEGIPLTYYFDDIEAINGEKIKEVPKKQDLMADKSKKQTLVIDIVNSEYMKAPNINDNIEITDTSTVEDIFKKINYHYANREFDKAIELCELALTKTNDRELTARIYFSLSSHYLEKGIQPYLKNKDDSFYKKSLEFAKKSLEVFSTNWQVLANMGAVYLNMGDWKQAAFYYLEAEKCLNKDDPHYGEIKSMRVLAETQSKKEAAT
ncbi:MAG: hypothetical protein ABH865_01830 [Candidatus Omnitrophota bacterium]|nr:tetratricopeptide repeat protein [Candidatus Omnitrophota bacterium]